MDILPLLSKGISYTNTPNLRIFCDTFFESDHGLRIVDKSFTIYYDFFIFLLLGLVDVSSSSYTVPRHPRVTLFFYFGTTNKTKIRFVTTFGNS